MMASSPVRTHLAMPPLSHPPRIENGMTYPSTKVSFVLEETDESPSSYMGKLGGGGDEGLLTPAHCWYIPTRSTDYKPPTLPVPLARRMSHRA